LAYLWGTGQMSPEVAACQGWDTIQRVGEEICARLGIPYAPLEKGQEAPVAIKTREHKSRRKIRPVKRGRKIGYKANEETRIRMAAAQQKRRHPQYAAISI